MAIAPSRASALSGRDFNPSYIIDDSLFFNGNSMSTQDIQNFLNSKVPVCDTWHAARDGNNPPFICLKEYQQNVPTRYADAYCSGTVYGGVKTAAQILYEVGAACSINPKVLIVLLQKEQSLITDTWPWNVQYEKATGYYCPDDPSRPGWCDPEYGGFYNQVWYAARQFQRYVKQPQNFNYAAGRTSWVRYQANNDGCGGSYLRMANGATAALYNYTPYQPNQAALNNLYGLGDGCSAYGNRNFWRLYNDWFGPTTGVPAFRAEYESQSPYPIIDSGTGVSVYFQFKNTGSSFWKDDLSNFPGYSPVRLATTLPINRSSMFRASNWSGASRPTGFLSAVYEADGVTKTSDQHTVFPGQIGRYEFTIYADPNAAPGVYREYFQPILEGASSWDIGGLVHLDIGINRPDYQASFHSQGGYQTIARGGSSYTFFRFANTGSSPWYDENTVWPGKNAVRLAATWPINRSSSFAATSWPFVNRPASKFYKVLLADGTTLAPNQHVVQPGQIAEFAFTVNVPSNMAPGVYREYFQPIAEGAPFNRWDMGAAAWTQFTVE